MPSTSQQRRGRPPVRRSPRSAPWSPSAAPPSRPMQVPFAGLFGLLVAVEYGYLAWLLSFGWYLAVPVVLSVGAVTGVVLLWAGRPRGWQVLTVVAALLLLALMALAVLFGLIGGGAALWSAVALLAGPVGCLALTLQRPVRRWRGAGRPTRSPGGRRTGPRSG